MGNCIHTFPKNPKQQQQQQQELLQNDSSNNDSKRMRIKMVLTKEELEWLMLQINSGTAAVGKRQLLEDVLWEIHRSREKGQQRLQQQPWKPCLESIDESPSADDGGDDDDVGIYR